jgi:hypothetical protein
MKQHAEMKMKTVQGFAFFVMIALVPATCSWDLADPEL